MNLESFRRYISFFDNDPFFFLPEHEPQNFNEFLIELKALYPEKSMLIQTYIDQATLEDKLRRAKVVVHSPKKCIICHENIDGLCVKCMLLSKKRGCRERICWGCFGKLCTMESPKCPTCRNLFIL